ncbi:MAG: hypothetical protein AAF215_08225 [Cyanobacteria bacterium P01_A01_bin.123]
MTESKSYTIKATAKKTGLRFAGGAGAGLIAFALFGGIWQVNHFGWVMTITAFSFGLLAVLLGQNFKKTLTALMDNAPWI